MISKNRRWIGLSIWLLLTFVLGACDPAILTQGDRGVLTPSADEAPAAVPEQQQYSNPDFGYSLSYPAGYLLQSAFPHKVDFLAPAGTPGHRERAWLTVELASEENAEWYANQAKEENANLGTEITFSAQVLDGQQAHVLGRMPGQDLNRQVFVVHKGILYHLTFAPDDPAGGEAYQQMEALYATIMSSLRFLPERRAVPPVTEMSNMMHHVERALNTRSADDIARLLGDEFVLGDLNPSTPEGFTFSRHGRSDVAPLILNNHLSQAPAVSLQREVDWASVAGSLDTYSWFFPGEDVTAILARGWGPNGANEAVIIIAQRIDSSLSWRGAFVLQGASAP